MGLSLKATVRSWPQATQEEWIASLDEQTLAEVARDEWWFSSRPEQVPVNGPWNVHVVLSGRGWGKTRSGAEWIVERSIRYPYDTSGFPTERLVVAPTLSDCRAQCVEGPSGIIRSLERREIAYRYTKAPKPLIILTDIGPRIHFIDSDPDRARGYNLADVWMDEIGKWADAKASWYEGIMPALRTQIPGDHPRAYVTTTPKTIPLLLEWVDRHTDPTDQSVSMIRGSTFDNADNLSQLALEEMLRRYENTDLGRQELYGEMLDLGSGNMFRQGDINRARVDIGPLEIVSRVVGVDPSLTGSGADHQDEMGVVVASRDSRDHMYVLADESRFLAGRDAALHIWNVFARYEADVVVYEDNLGKAWMRKVLEDAYYELRDQGLFPQLTNPPLKAVHSNQGKTTRAEPVAMRCQQGRIHMIGEHPILERQMIGWDPLTSKQSPDRMDALVHACRWLMEGERKRVRIASAGNRGFVGTENSYAPVNGKLPYGAQYLPWS